MASIFVTGFGPFAGFEENPSALLAQSLDCDHAVLPVAFDEVDAFVAAFPDGAYDALLLLGVRTGGARLDVELAARNAVGETQDVRGRALRPGPIDPALPARLSSTLWTDPRWLRLSPLRGPSLDAGDYLCNYVYFRALARLRATRVGFVHVPPVEAIPLPRQRSVLRRIVDRLTHDASREGE